MSDYALDQGLSSTAAAPEPQPRRRGSGEDAEYTKVSAGGRTSQIIYPAGPRLQIAAVIDAGDRTYWMRRTLALDVEYHGEDGVIVRHGRLRVHGHGDTLEAALGDFGETFDVLYRRLEASQDRLSPHARNAWETLQGFVQRIS